MLPCPIAIANLGHTAKNYLLLEIGCGKELWATLLQGLTILFPTYHANGKQDCTGTTADGPIKHLFPIKEPWLSTLIKNPACILQVS